AAAAAARRARPGRLESDATVGQVLSSSRAAHAVPRPGGLMKTARLVAVAALLLSAVPGARGLGLNSVPSRITVQPVFIVPRDSTMGEPTPTDVALLDSALHSARAQYLEMLHWRDTFTIANAPVIIRDTLHTRSYYGADTGGAMAEAAMAYF